MSHHLFSLFDSHSEAVLAVNELKQNGVAEKQISLLGKADVGTSGEVKDEKTAIKGAGIGGLVGVLAGVGLTMIPGIGWLYGVGALAGAVAGLDFGLIGGTIIGSLAISNMDKNFADRYERALQDGKTLLVIAGSMEEMNIAKGILHAQGQHTALDIHQAKA